MMKMYGYCDNYFYIYEMDFSFILIYYLSLPKISNFKQAWNRHLQLYLF